MPVKTIGRGGTTFTVLTSRSWFTATPLPRKTPEELAYAAAWGARRLLEATIAAGSGGLYPTSRGRGSWSEMKRHFAIPIADNGKLKEAWRDACAKLDLLSVSHWYTVPREERPASWPWTAAQWYAEHLDRIEELLRRSGDLEAASRPRKP